MFAGASITIIRILLYIKCTMSMYSISLVLSIFHALQLDKYEIGTLFVQLGHINKMYFVNQSFLMFHGLSLLWFTDYANGNQTGNPIFKCL